MAVTCIQAVVFEFNSRHKQSPLCLQGQAFMQSCGRESSKCVLGKCGINKAKLYTSLRVI